MKTTVTFVVLCIIGTQALGIGMRHDRVGAAGADDKNAVSNLYIAEGQMAAYNAVAFLNLGTATGTGTLVPSINTGPFAGQFKILTAAHNVDHNNDGTLDSTNITACFGSNVGTDMSDNIDCSTASAVVSNIMDIDVISNWQTSGGAAQFDVAVLTFTAAQLTSGTLPTPMPVATSNPATGTEVAMAGHGGFGTGDAPFENRDPDGILRVGRNHLDLIGTPPMSTPDGDKSGEGFVLAADFDSPAGTAPPSSLGSAVPHNIEAGTATGDSGGPVINVGAGVLLGVLNGGYRGSTNPVSEYGDVSMWAPIHEPSGANLAFIQGQGIAVPEPSALLLIGLAASAGFAYRWARRAL